MPDAFRQAHSHMIVASGVDGARHRALQWPVDAEALDARVLEDARFRRVALFRFMVKERRPLDISALLVERLERVAKQFWISIQTWRGENMMFLNSLESEPWP